MGLLTDGPRKVAIPVVDNYHQTAFDMISHAGDGRAMVHQERGRKFGGESLWFAGQHAEDNMVLNSEKGRKSAFLSGSTLLETR